jgi:cyanophycin synthetase
VKIRKIRTIAGPNLFHRLPILVMTLDLEDLANVASDEIPGFTDRLVEMLPGLKEHRCSPGVPGGFIERLRRGTYFAHIVEHIALELSGPAGVEVGYGKSVYAGQEGIYDVVVRFKDEETMRFLLRTAVELAEAVIAGHSYPVDRKIEEDREIHAEFRLGPCTKAIVDAAERRGIPWQRLNQASLIEFGYGKHIRRIQATTSTLTGDIAVDIAQDKNLTKAMLERALLPVPKGVTVDNVEAAIEALHEIGGRVAIKPLDGNHGRGVSLNIRTDVEAAAAFEIARERSSDVIVEECVDGRDYRVVVVGGRMVAAAERVPAHVTGDGKLTIRELIDLENRNPLRGEGHRMPLTRIEIDDAAACYLRRAGIELDSVPEAGRRIQLRETANLSTGGKAVDVTDLVHPDFRSICERAALVVGLDIAGIDLIASDISRSPELQRAAIIEVNAGPGIRMHHFPSEGQPRDVAATIVENMFPEGSNGRVPVIGITGTNGKTTVTRMIGHLFVRKGMGVGMTTSDGIYFNKQLLHRGDTTGPASARVVLADPRVEVAVLETARGGIVRRGIGYDLSDVGVITNIQPDHIGQDGIETVEDILRIKSLVAETVQPGGSLVLNADDPLVLSLREKESVRASEKKVVLFSLDAENPEIVRHVEAGGTAYFVRDGMMIEVRGGETTAIAPVASIPATFAGSAAYQIANAMAAVAAGRAVGLTIDEARVGIQSFHPVLDNSGRTNAYRVGGGYVFIDYAHNPEALRAIGKMARNLRATRVTGVISAPGDRSDDMIRMSGQAAAESFDRVIVREDIDLRGRKPGETATLLCREIGRVNPSMPCLTELDSEAALRTALQNMQAGEMVLYFYDALDPLKEVLGQFGAKPLTDFQEIFSIGAPDYAQVC